jgi:hypothetical protein
MKKTATMVLAAAVLAATLSLVVAGSFKDEPVTAADALPAHEIAATVRAMGLAPIGKPLRRGAYYVLHAYDPRGVEVRVVADAQLGDILSVVPANAPQNAYAPRYQRGPHIIHVPKPRAHRVSAYDRQESALPDDYDDVSVAPPAPHRRMTPPPHRHSKVSAPPPQKKQRTVLSAPPPRASGLTPIYPTPRFDAKAEAQDKFDPPHEKAPAAAENLQPPGYTPPAALPQSD